MVGWRMSSFHVAPGRSDGFWSASNTEISFFGKFTLIKVLKDGN